MRVRYNRLAIEDNGRTLKLAFHPRFTVITGVGSTSRESMVRELIGGLGTNRAGTHLEVHTDSGRNLTLFRPPDAAHRAIDMDSGQDVSEEYRSQTSVVDLLNFYGLDTATARRWMRVGPNDLVATTHSQQLIARLARLDQSEMWSAAQRVRVAEQTLASQEPPAPVEDEKLTARIDDSYQSLDEAIEQNEKTRKLAFIVAAVGIAIAAALISTSAAASIAALAVAAAATATTFVFRARVQRHQKRLSEALGEAGSDSYLGYQLSRIDHYVTDEHHRRHRVAANDDLAESMIRWKQLVGDVAVDWAVEHRPAIEAAARLRGAGPRNGDNETGSDLVPSHHLASDETPELIESLLNRLGRARQLGKGDESFPLLLDEPFGTLDPSIRPALLEVLLAQAGTPQIILLTNEEDVVAWARLEAITGALTLVGPGEGLPTSDEAREEPAARELWDGQQSV